MLWERRSPCTPEVFQTGMLPHLVLCLPQMVGLGSSHVEDMTLIHNTFTWCSSTVLCNISNLLKGEQHPDGKVNYQWHFKGLTVLYSNILAAMCSSICLVHEVSSKILHFYATVSKNFTLNISSHYCPVATD